MLDPIHPMAGPLTRAFHNGAIAPMSELSAALGNAAPPHQITHGGRTYTFHLLDQKRKSALEKRVYQNAREHVFADREHMTSAEYTARLERVRELYERSEYSIFGTQGAAILQSPKGVLLLLEVITGESEEDLFALLLARPEEIKSVLAVVMSESFGGRTGAAPVVAPNG